MDYCKFDQVVVPNVTATSVILYLLEQISMALDKWYVVIDLVSAFFFHIHSKKGQKQYALLWKRQQDIFTILCQGEC